MQKRESEKKRGGEFLGIRFLGVFSQFGCIPWE